MRNRYTCIFHGNKGRVVCLCLSCSRETEAFVLCLHFIVMVEDGMGEILGVLSASFFWYSGGSKLELLRLTQGLMFGTV